MILVLKENYLISYQNVLRFAVRGQYAQAVLKFPKLDTQA
jgi:hypothetical protein